MADVLRIKRRASGGAGAPAALANAELAFNEVDNTLYYGKGNNAGAATSIIPIAGNNYPARAAISSAPPAGATQGTLWWDSDEGQLYIYFDDGTGAQWVAATKVGP